MAEEHDIAPPKPRSVNTWKLPSVIRIEGDGHDPRKTRILDDRTGEEVQLPIQKLQFNVDVDHPNSVEMLIGGVAVRAVVHHVQYNIEEDDLSMLAKQNGFEIVRVPFYPARLMSYGPAEHQFKFADFPDLIVTHANPAGRESIEAAEKALRDYLSLAHGPDFKNWPPQREAEENEVAIWAHKQS